MIGAWESQSQPRETEYTHVWQVLLSAHILRQLGLRRRQAGNHLDVGLGADMRVEWSLRVSAH